MVSKPIYKPFSPFGSGITLLRGPTNHGDSPLTKWDHPPSSGIEIHLGNDCKSHSPKIIMTSLGSGYPELKPSPVASGKGVDPIHNHII